MGDFKSPATGRSPRGNATDYLRVLVLARTGMRAGEATGLKVGDLDLRRGYAIVRRTYDDAHGAGTPKSGKTRRVDLITG